MLCRHCNSEVAGSETCPSCGECLKYPRALHVEGQAEHSVSGEVVQVDSGDRPQSVETATQTAASGNERPPNSQSKFLSVSLRLQFIGFQSRAPDLIIISWGWVEEKV